MATYAKPRNPAGRTKGSKNKLTEMREVGYAKVSDKLDTCLKFLDKVLADEDEDTKNKLRTIEILLDRILPKLKSTELTASVTMSVDNALQATICAIDD